MTYSKKFLMLSALSIVSMCVFWVWFLSGYKFGVPKADDLNYFYFVSKDLLAGNDVIRTLRDGHGAHISIQQKLISTINLKFFGYDMRWLVMAGPFIAAGWILVVLLWMYKQRVNVAFIPILAIFIMTPVMFRQFDYNMIAFGGSLNFLGMYIFFYSVERYYNSGKITLFIGASLYLVFVVATKLYGLLFASAVAAGLVLVAARFVPGVETGKLNARKWALRIGIVTAVFAAGHIAYEFILIETHARSPGRLDITAIPSGVLYGFFNGIGGRMLEDALDVEIGRLAIGGFAFAVYVTIVLATLKDLIRKRRIFVLCLLGYPLVAMAGILVLRGDEATLFPRYAAKFSLVWVGAALAVAVYGSGSSKRLWIKRGLFGLLLLVAMVHLSTLHQMMGYRQAAARMEAAALQTLETGEFGLDFNPALFNCRLGRDRCIQVLTEIRERRDME